MCFCVLFVGGQAMVHVLGSEESLLEVGRCVGVRGAYMSDGGG